MAKSVTPSKKDSSNQPAFIFGKINFILMVAGIVVITAGYLLMVGGHPEDPAVFNPEEKYSFTRITLAPIVIITGLVIEIVAIMVKARD